MERNQDQHTPEVESESESEFEEREEDEDENRDTESEADASDQYYTDTEEELEFDKMADVKQQKTSDQKVVFVLGKEDGSETAKPKKSTTSKAEKDIAVKLKTNRDGDKSVGSGQEKDPLGSKVKQTSVGLRKQTVAQRSQASFQRRQQLVSQRSQVMNSQRGFQLGTQKSQIGIQKSAGASQRSQVSLMKSQSSFQKKQNVSQKNSSSLQKTSNAQRSTVNIQRSQGIGQRSQANFQRSQANFQRSQANFQKISDKASTRSRAASAKVQSGIVRKTNLQKSVSSPDTGDETDQKKSSVSSDGDTSPVKLYQPKPTLKELAESASVAPSKGKIRPKGMRQSATNLAKIANKDSSLINGKSHKSILKEFKRKESLFHEQISFLYESPPKKPPAKKGPNSSTKSKANLDPKQNLGFSHLDNLLNIMEHIAVLKTENDGLKRKCNVLEDSKTLLNLQNQMLNANRLKQMNKSESFISKAQSKVKHYLVSPIVHPSSPLYQRVHSDSGSGIPLELLDSPKLKSPKGLKRSTSVGSMEELDLASPITCGPQEHSCEKETKRSTMKKKVNKKFAKMKRVFGKPESGSKLDSGAISAEEIIRINKQKSLNGRPSSLAPSKSFDHGDLGGGSISDDNCGTGNSHLFVEPPRSVPPSPSSIKSEPGTAFPSTTKVEPEPEEMPPTPSKSEYVDIGGTKSVRTIVRAISQTDSSYSANAGMEDRISLSDNDSEKSCSFELGQVGYPLVRRKSSPTLSKHTSDTDGTFGLTTPIEIRRSSSFKARSKRPLLDGDRIIRNTAYITENLLSPEDAKRAQIQMRSKDGEVHKKAKAAWVKVKDIIHTRKDSIKKTRRRSISGIEEFEISPDGSSWEDRITLQGDFSYDDDGTVSDQDVVLKEPAIVRSHTVKPIASSPKVMRKRAASVKTPSELSCPISATKRDSVAMISVAGGQFDVSALMGGLNEDFHKKMSEWEDKKKKGAGGKGDGTSPKMQGDTKFTEDFIRRMEQWEKIKGINKGIESTSPPKCKEASSPKASQSPPPVKPQAEQPIQAEAVEHLSESFSKTVQEWERIKEKRAKEPDTISHSGSSKGSRTPRRKERSKSGDRNPRDKSRQRYEREIQKREQKLDKERQKLDKMKHKLENADYPPAGAQPADFLGKFYDWELLKNFNNALSVNGGGEHHARSRSEKRSREVGGPGRDRIFSDSSLATQDLDFRSHGDIAGGLRGDDSQSFRSKESDSNTETSSSQQASSPLVDDSTSIDVALTMETIAMLESANEKLSEELSDKEGDLSCLRHQMKDLSERVQELTEQHRSDIECYKKELWASSKIGQFTIESQNLTSSLKHLKQKLNELQEHGERVMAEKKAKSEVEWSEKSLWSERESELLQQIQVLQTQLDQKIYTQPADTQVFQTLYNYVTNAHTQVHSLQQGVFERDHMISYLQQHVLVQEVYNLLMITELQRKDAIVSFLKQQKKAGILRRWNTFHAQDLMLRQDGTIALKKTDHDYPVVPPCGKRLKTEYDDMVTDRTEALQFHFDWIENIRQQVQDVQDKQKVDTEVQASIISQDTDSQTVVSLVHPEVHLSRLQWDGTCINVCDRGVQHKVTTADAAVWIEDVEVYERKQRKKWTAKGAENSAPEVGTVYRRREMFDTTKTHEKQGKRSRKVDSKQVGTTKENFGNRTVIGRKLLDFEHCEPVAKEEVEVTEAKVLEAKPYQEFTIAFEKVEPEFTTLQESSLTSQSGTNNAAGRRRDLPSVSSTGSSDIEVSFTVLLNDEKEQLPVTLSEDENAKDLVNEKDTVCGSVKGLDDTESNVLHFVKCQFTETTPDEIIYNICSNSDSNICKMEQTELSSSVPKKTPSCDDIIDARPPLSPIVRSKYSRPRLRNEKHGEGKPPGHRAAVNHARRNNSTGDVEPTARARTSSDSSTIHSKFGSTDVEETTAAKFSVKMEKYLIKPRGSEGIPLQEKVVRSFEAQPFSRDCLLRRSPLPAMKKPAVSAMRKLKTAEELMNDTYKRGRSLSVPKEGMIGIFSKDIKSGQDTPHSLPAASPNTTRKSNSDLMKEVTKRLSLPTGSLQSDINITQIEQLQSKFVPVKRKALVLEPVIFDTNRQVRPHSIISYISESEQSSPSESIWQKLVKPKSSSLQRERTTRLPSEETPPSRRGGTHFKLFSRPKPHGSSHHKKGAITKLCMHTVTLDTSESDSGSTQFLPEIEQQSNSSLRLSESPATPKKHRKMPFLDAKWLSRSKRFFKQSNVYSSGRSKSESQSEADVSSSQSNSMCDSNTDKHTSCDSNLDDSSVIARRALSEEKVGDLPLIQVHNDW